MLRQLFVRTVAPVYCLLIKMFDQLKNSRHELIFISDVCWLFQNAVMFISGLILLGINDRIFFHLVAKRQMHFVSTLGRTSGEGGGGGWGLWFLRSLYFFLDDKISAPDVFNSFLLFSLAGILRQVN